MRSLTIAAAAGITWATLAGCGTTTAPVPVTEPAPLAAPQYYPSGDTRWDAGVQVGIDYWTGREPDTTLPTIQRDTTNRCGKQAMACTVGFSDGTCRIWAKNHILKDRWATQAVFLHEVGHCAGHGHDDTDLVMHS